MSVGRNDRCPCGSGKKYKRCCLLREQSVIRATGEVLARQSTARNPGRGALVVQGGKPGPVLKTAPLAEYRREAKRLLSLADARGWSQTDLAERTGHTLDRISQALDPRHGVPLRLDVLHTIAEVLDTSLMARDSMTLAEGMTTLASLLGERVDDETRDLIRRARVSGDFAALRARFGRHTHEPASDPPTLVDIIQLLELSVDAPAEKWPVIEANLPAVVGLAEEPDFVISDPRFSS